MLGFAVLVAQHGTDGADLLAVPVELLVRAQVGAIEQVAQFLIYRRVIAQFALGEIVGDVHDRLAAQLMDDDFSVRVQQQRDAVGDCLVVFQGHFLSVIGCWTPMVAAKRN
ncbi:hypothetical protein D9M72_611890 [compost metagenome]